MKTLPSVAFVTAVAAFALAAVVAPPAEADVYIAQPAGTASGADVGRYQLVSAGDGLYVFDSATGRTWQAYLDEETMAIRWAPTIFAETEAALPPPITPDIPGLTTYEEEALTVAVFDVTVGHGGFADKGTDGGDAGAVRAREVGAVQIGVTENRFTHVR